MYDQILYPADGSDDAEAAVDHVRDLAETYRATVHVLYVVDVIRPATGIGDDPNKETSPGMVGDPDGADTPMVGDRELPEDLRGRARAHGEGVVEGVVNRLRGVETRTAVRGGDTHQVVIDYADSEDIDLIVVGTRGRTGLRRQLLGSVAERVFWTADVPVMAVREEDIDPFEVDGAAD
jgi:nucleotide-binding universal stress UspA family protein